MKQVVIIGAGPCGLVALKEMLAAGQDAILYERSEMLGGVFSSAAAYPDLHLTISNWLMSFSDFPDPDRQCYTSGEHYLRYLQKYARHFNLERHIKYGTEVDSASLSDDGRWDIRIHGVEGNTLETVRAHALIVAIGQNKTPKTLPEGLGGYTGRILHSSEYGEAFKKEVAEKELRVLVVGFGESGADISAELGDRSPNVTIWLRRQACVGPRYLNDKNELPQIEANKYRDFPANGFLEAATTCRISTAQNVYLYGFWRRLLWSLPILYPTLSRMDLESTTRDRIMNDQATYVTKNQRMCEAMHENKVKALVTPDISSSGKSVHFRMPDGTIKTREFDAIVMCNGYRTDFSWLQVKNFDPSPRSWFLHCFPAGYGDRLMFVGYARPHQGGIPPMADILSRYMALVVSEERYLPSNYAVLARHDGEAERDYYHINPYLDVLVDYNAYLESVARRVGCDPQMPLLTVVAFNIHMLATVLLGVSAVRPQYNPFGWRYTLLAWTATAASFVLLHNGLLVQWWFYPQWPVWYRQRGPGADPSLLANTLRRVNIWKSTSVTRGFALFLLWSIPTLYVQRLLSFAVFIPHVVLTSLGMRWSKAWGGQLRPKMFSLHSAEWRLKDLFLP